MRSTQPRRRSCALILTAFVSTSLPGCGSGKPADGTQVNVTIPPDEAKKQNDAYKDYAKQHRTKPKR